jgi:hypothetical protein
LRLANRFTAVLQPRAQATHTKMPAEIVEKVSLFAHRALSQIKYQGFIGKH